MKDILNTIKEGDSDQYRLIVNEYQNMIYRYIYKMIPDTYIAEELTQEVFITGYYNLHKFKENTSLKAWYYTIAKNLTLNHIKKKKREASLTEKLTLFKKSKEKFTFNQTTNEYNEAIEKALSTLSVDEKNLLILKSVEELSFNELSQIFNVKVPTLRKRYERTRKKFRLAYTGESEALQCQN